MPIPPFIDRYYLPPNEHECTFEEVEQRFLGTDGRVKVWRYCMGLLNRLDDLGLKPDIVLVDGSFVTARERPRDVDIAALIPPTKVITALQQLDDEDKEAVQLLVHPNSQAGIRLVSGTHLLVAHDHQGLDLWSKLFRKGKNGQLREPDPVLDPSWVRKPAEKGILKIIL